jgi:hypothetical protein
MLDIGLTKIPLPSTLTQDSTLLLTPFRKEAGNREYISVLRALLGSGSAVGQPAGPLFLHAAPSVGRAVPE